MNEIFYTALNRVYSHLLRKTKNLRVVNEYNFDEELTPFEYGMRIESYFLFQTYLLNYNIVINRFDTRTSCKNGELSKITAKVNGVPLSHRREVARVVEFDCYMRFPMSYEELLGDKKIAHNWMMPVMDVIRENQLLKKDIPFGDFDKLLSDGYFDKLLKDHYDTTNYDKRLLWQFCLARHKLKCKRRCLLKPKFIATFPDMVIDDTIIDIKTNSGFAELKDQCAQLLHQLIDFYAFLRFENVVYDDDTISDFDRKKILLPVRKICLYYYRYNKFFTVDLKKLLTEEEFLQLVAIKKDYSKIMF